MVKASLLWDFWNLKSDVFPIEKEVKKIESLSEASKDDDILKWWKFFSEGLAISLLWPELSSHLLQVVQKVRECFPLQGTW